MLQAITSSFGNSSRAAIRHRRDGFSLLELLVVIAIIGVVTAITLPALSKARASARLLVCLNNHRQLSVAWSAYVNDYRVFPYGERGPVGPYKIRRDWGGVNWFLSNNVPGFNLGPDRPLNPYVAGDQVLERRVVTFRCPLDDGFRYFNTGVNGLVSLGTNSVSGEPSTFFGVVGNSYQCNQWMYCKPGETSGWQDTRNFRTNLAPHDVQVSPSRFVVLLDGGPADWFISTETTRRTFDLGGSWWHGPERSPLSFLDGSVRIERSGLLVNDRYSFHLLPMRPQVANAGWQWPERR
ncbi:MAG: prepilin-type N-terminal cleavage/methylation domain-containing protein [Phycisphaerales bacterium]|nr:prepilin-type N-terminal cleavage/methylation domain-containing protein [Phycisphaerales bacterium]